MSGMDRDPLGVDPELDPGSHFNPSADLHTPDTTPTHPAAARQAVILLRIVLPACALLAVLLGVVVQQFPIPSLAQGAIVAALAAVAGGVLLRWWRCTSPHRRQSLNPRNRWPDPRTRSIRLGTGVGVWVLLLWIVQSLAPPFISPLMGLVNILAVSALLLYGLSAAVIAADPAATPPLAPDGAVSDESALDWVTYLLAAPATPTDPNTPPGEPGTLTPPEAGLDALQSAWENEQSLTPPGGPTRWTP